MIVAAHQPHLLPWLGYFDKMRQADLFVIVDHVQFERQNYQNRVMVKTGPSAQWIIVPVHHGSREERIIEKRIDNTGTGRHRWSRRIGLTLKYAYQAAPHFSEVAPAVFEVLDARWDRLIDLNMTLLDLCRERLGIRTPILRSSEMRFTRNTSERDKSDMVLNLCRELGADVYLSGAGASRSYLDAAAFDRAGVQIRWQEFTHPAYPQRPSPNTFIPKLSVVDLLVNCGAESGSVLQGKPAEEPAEAVLPLP